VIQSLRTPLAVLLFLCAAVGAKLSSPHAHDFPLIVYYPERAFLEGGSPYDRASYLAHYPDSEPFAPYLPGILLVDLPFGLPPLAPAELGYYGFMVALTAWLAYLAMRYNGLRPRAATVLLLASVIVLSRPGRMNLVLGNVTLQVVIASYVALYYARRRPWLSGTGLALAMLKPSFGAPLGLLMLAMRDVRPVALGAGLTALLNLPVAAILASRAGGVGPLLEQLLGAWRDYQTRVAYNDSLYSPSRIDAAALLSRFSGYELGASAQVLVALIVLALAAVALRAAKRNHSDTSLGFSAGIIAGAVLLSGYHQPYDVLLLVLPFVAVVYRRLPAALDRPAFRYGLLALYIVPAVNYLATFQGLVWLGVLPVISAPVVSRQPWVLVLVSLNGLALLALFASYALAAVRQPVSEVGPPTSAGHPAAVRS